MRKRNIGLVVLAFAVLLAALLLFPFVAPTPVDAHSSSHAARVYGECANWRILTGTWRPVDHLTQERWDTSNMHSGSITACSGPILISDNPEAIKAPVTGYYLITGHVRWAANANGNRIVTIREGTAYSPGSFIAAQNNPNQGSGEGVNQSVSTVWYLTQNQYVSLWVYQNSGSDLNLNTQAKYAPEFSMTYLGP